MPVSPVSFDVSNHGRKVSLSGDGWRIDVEITKDDGGVRVSSGGDFNGGERLVVLPVVSNVVEISTDVAREDLVNAEAKRRHEVWVENEKANVFRTRKGKKKGAGE